MLLVYSDWTESEGTIVCSSREVLVLLVEDVDFVTNEIDALITVKNVTMLSMKSCKYSRVVGNHSNDVRKKGTWLRCEPKKVTIAKTKSGDGSQCNEGECRMFPWRIRNDNIR